ncbi:ankyrin [Hypoxylon sp. FL1150]|nr:ankyrin [Hypoxylon sp. FL1150]
MNSASPTTSASTNRGGRPKDWTDERSRRLVRLYIYTRLPFDLILSLLEEGVWKPGYVKDAANKVKNSLLGNDPRWIRPKDEDDERRRITALRNSRRGAKYCKKSSGQPTRNDSVIHSVLEGDCLTRTQSRQTSFEPPDTVSQATFDPTYGFGAGDEIQAPYSGRIDYNSLQFPWMTNDANAARQDTGFTNSTETSMSSSFREKLTSVSRDQAKGAWRVLKRFTLTKDHSDLQRSPISPIMSPVSQLRPPQHFHGLVTQDPSSARYAVPGDFLNPHLFSQKFTCPIDSWSHGTNTCWCRIVKELSEDPTMTPFSDGSISPSKISGNFNQKDTFGNTAFHRLAAVGADKRFFINLIDGALKYPDLPLHNTNTAGQTFLHVLHQSWFDETNYLDELLNILKRAGFDILAVDVYGRSFFHVLQNRKQDAARIPPHLFDWNLLRRRDAFGVIPMNSRNRQSNTTTMQVTHRGGLLNSRSPGVSGSPPTINIPSNLGDESRILSQTEMLKIVLDAVKVDTINVTQPDPRSEDSHGRNAFQCLAEVELDVHRVQGSVQKKRKFKEEEEEETKPAPGRREQRLEFLRGIIHARVDVNHYDNRGQTPLMSFIRYRPEESRSDKEDMERTIRMLREAGADLEKRNRQGETALHVAARSGKKVALKELLQLGANPFVRDACNLSVLAAIDELWISTEADGALTARLEACRGVFTSAVKADAQEPTVEQEWGWGAARPAAAPFAPRCH